MTKHPNGSEYIDLTLTNGEVATFKGVDFWSRPFYGIMYGGNELLVCCPNMTGTHLHYYSPRNDVDGEPDSPIPNRYQPKSTKTKSF